MFCNNCGMELQEGLAFCPNCGSKTDGDNPQSRDDAKTVILSNDPHESQEEGQKTEASNNNMQRRFCPNCGMENKTEDTFCKECGMPLGVQNYGIRAVESSMQAGAPTGGQVRKKKKGLLIGIGAAVVLVLVIAIAVAAINGAFMGTNGKVLKAIASTLEDAPEIVSDLKVIPNILTGDQYTVGFEMEYDGDSIGGEFRNTVNDKQIYVNADWDGDDIDLLCGVHSGVLKASVSDLDYLFLYDPKRENDGFLCENIRKKQLEELNNVLENITTEKVSIKEIQKDITASFIEEFNSLEFKEVKSKEFEVDRKDRECKGYKIRINEKSVAHVLENASERISKRIDGSVVDDFEDMMNDLVDEIESDDWDMDVTFYLYKNKLAAVIVEIDDYAEEEIAVEFLGGDYRMQNILATFTYNGRTYGEIEMSVQKKGSKETIEIDATDDINLELTYDTKSGEVSLECDDGRSDYLVEGVYNHSGSEASFTLKELEYDGDSLVDDMDVMVMMYVKKAVEIGKYNGEEFDLGNADEDDFEDLADDLEDYIDLLEDVLY